jgi:diguanylate cyclase (GGDEF)-like protein/PAS domain S-box-containing protein
MPDPEPTWDLDRLRTIATGATVRCEGAPDDVARAMAVLGPVAAPDPNDTPLASRLHSFHVDDRERMVLAWRAALDEPGVLTQADGRHLVDDTWVRSQMWFINLVEADLRVMVAMITDLGPVPEDEIPRAGELDPVPGAPASWALVTLSLDGRVTSAEGTTRDLLGWSPDELMGVRLVQAIHPDDRTAVSSMAAVVVSMPGIARALTHRVVRRDQTEVWVESTTSYRADTQEIQALLTDISVRRAQEAALQASREEIRELAEEFGLLAEDIPSGAFRADAHGHIRFANTHFRALAGRRRVDDLRSLAAAADAPLVDEAIALAIERAAKEGSEAVDPVQVEFRGGDRGRTLQLRLNATTGSAGTSTALVGLLVDATPTVELRTRARTDNLTGLLNRSALDDHLAAAVADGIPVSVLFVDLDRFKLVNDEHGHHAGDEVLRAVARRLRNATRSAEELGRYGGDEFVVVCRTDDQRVLDEVASRVTAALTNPIRFEGGLWQPSASIGVAIARPGDDPADLLRRADAEMYRTKASRAAGPRDENTA